MLEKNDEAIQKIGKMYKKELAHFTRSRLAVFKLVPRYFKYDKLNKRTLPPRSVRIEAFYSIYEDGETNYYRYYTTKRHGRKDEMIYAPNFLVFNEKGYLTVKEDQPDLFMFLLKNSRRALNKNLDPSKKAIFYLEDRKTEATERASKKKQLAAVNNLIWGEEGLSDDVIRQVSKTYGIPNVDAQGIDQVKESLEKKVQGNPSLFLEKKQLGPDMEIRALIQDACDQNIIVYKATQDAASWNIIGHDGKEIRLCLVRPGENKNDRLVTYLREVDQSDSISLIEELVAERKKVNKKELA